jgi:hypothetical protein
MLKQIKLIYKEREFNKIVIENIKMRATNLMYRNPYENTPCPYDINVTT